MGNVAQQCCQRGIHAALRRARCKWKSPHGLTHPGSAASGPSRVTQHSGFQASCLRGVILTANREEKHCFYSELKYIYIYCIYIQRYGKLVGYMPCCQGCHYRSRHLSFAKSYEQRGFKFMTILHSPILSGRRMFPHTSVFHLKYTSWLKKS